MADAATWKDIEGRIKDLTNALQSLPSESQRKALDLLALIGQKVKSEGTDSSTLSSSCSTNEDTCSTSATLPVSTEKKKRGRPSQKSIVKCALPPATSSKKVVNQPVHVVGVIIEDNVSVPVIETTKKKRGRPPMKKPEKCVEASVHVANGSVAGPTRQGVRIPSEENGKNTLQRTDLSAGGSVRPKECHVVIEQSKGLGNTADWTRSSDDQVGQEFSTHFVKMEDLEDLDDTLDDVKLHPTLDIEQINRLACSDSGDQSDEDSADNKKAKKPKKDWSAEETIIWNGCEVGVRRGGLPRKKIRPVRPGRRRGRPKKSLLVDEIVAKDTPAIIKSEDAPNYTESMTTNVNNSGPINDTAVSGTGVRRKTGRPTRDSYETGCYVPKEKLYECSTCHKKLTTKMSLISHVKHHFGLLCICPYCGQQFQSEGGLEVHKMYQHSKDVPESGIFKCTYCKYIVSTQALLDDHYRRRHDPNRPRTNICDICGKGFRDQYQLEKHHQRTHATDKQYKCDLCDFSTAYENGVEKHKANIHYPNPTMFRCELCDCLLKSRVSYIGHLGRHFNERKKTCSSCGKRFSNASSLASHMQTHGEPTLPCPTCGKKLRNIHKLKIHELIHTGQKDLSCPECSYVTGIKHNLRKHCMNRHKIVYPPLVSEHIRRFSPTELVTDIVSDPLAKKELERIVGAAAATPEILNSVENLNNAQQVDVRPSANVIIIKEHIMTDDSS